jgi:hypothetical protein
MDSDQPSYYGVYHRFLCQLSHRLFLNAQRCISRFYPSWPRSVIPLFSIGGGVHNHELHFYQIIR